MFVGLSGNHGTISEETRRFEKNFYIYIWITDKTEDSRFKMMYEIAYACENENMCEIKEVVILVQEQEENTVEEQHVH